MRVPLDDEARARLNGRRASHGIVIVIAVVFVGASAAQIIPAVFGWGARTLPVAAPGSPERTCADGIRGLADALDRAGAQAGESGGRTAERGAPVERDAALGMFGRALAVEWPSTSDLEQACRKSDTGADAWAALTRLRRAHEELVLRDLQELSALRHDVAVRLPP
jgi:hypothetical protein